MKNNGNEDVAETLSEILVVRKYQWNNLIFGRALAMLAGDPRLIPDHATNFSNFSNFTFYKIVSNTNPKQREVVIKKSLIYQKIPEFF